MGKKNRKNSGRRLPSQPQPSSSGASPDTIEGFNLDRPSMELADVGGGLFADYFHSLKAFLGHIVPEMPHTEPVSVLVDAVEAYASISTNILPSFIFNKLGFCVEVHYDIFVRGCKNAELRHHRSALEHMLKTLAPLVLVVKVKVADDPDDPDDEGEVHLVDEDGLPLRSGSTMLDLMERTKHPAIEWKSERDRHYTIEHLLCGNEMFQVGVFFSTVRYYRRIIDSRWTSMRHELDHCQEEGLQPPLFSIMQAGLWTNEITKQVFLLERHLMATFPCLSSFAAMIAVVAFDEAIGILVDKHIQIERADSIKFVAAIIQATMDDPKYPLQGLEALRRDQNVALPNRVNRIVKEMKQRGVKRADAANLARHIMYYTLLFTVSKHLVVRLSKRQAAYESSACQPIIGDIMNTHVLLEKSRDNTMHPVTVQWSERDHPATNIGIAMDSIVTDVIHPELMRSEFHVESDDIFPWVESRPVDGKPLTVSFSFVAHSILVSLFCVQGNDRIKSTGVAARVAFVSWWNRHFHEHQSAHLGASNREEIAIWNPYVAGLWLAKMLRMSHHAPLDDPDFGNNIRFALFVYEFLKKESQIAPVTVLEVILTYERYWFADSSYGDFHFERKRMIPKRKMLESVLKLSKTLAEDADYITLDMKAIAKLMAQLPGILCNFFVHGDDTLEDWLDTFMANKDPDSMHTLGICIFDFFDDNKCVELFHSPRNTEV